MIFFMYQFPVTLTLHLDFLYFFLHLNKELLMQVILTLIDIAVVLKVSKITRELLSYN